jgi:nucleoside-diphosphate-sugar epimerase
MNILFIGGTGNISLAASQAVLEAGHKLTIVTRNRRSASLKGARQITADINEDHGLEKALGSTHFDAVVDWIAFTVPQIERDIELFRRRTDQFIFVSSASVYQKPPLSPFVTESTPRKNPFWQYSRNKIACEDRLLEAWRNNDFPVTIVRPSHTYSTVLPLSVGGWTDYTVIERIKQRKKVVVHGDGTSLWVLTHARDFAKGLVGLLANPHALGEAFHITSDEVLTWDQIYNIVGHAVGEEPIIVHVPSDTIALFDPRTGAGLLGDKAHSVIFDNSKIRRFAPGFQATVSFREGIIEVLDWFHADHKRMNVSDEQNALFDRMIKVQEYFA